MGAWEPKKNWSCSVAQLSVMVKETALSWKSIKFWGFLLSF